MPRTRTNPKGPGALEVGYDRTLSRARLTDSEKQEAVQIVRMLNETLTSRGVSGAEFSRQIGMSHASVSRFLRGERYGTRPFVLMARRWLAGELKPVPKKSQPTSDDDEVLVADSYDMITSDPWLGLPEI